MEEQTEREILRNAAFSLKLKAVNYGTKGELYVYTPGRKGVRKWDPKNNSAHAFDLAALHNFSVNVRWARVEVRSNEYFGEVEEKFTEETRLAAARWAIVRMAARVWEIESHGKRTDC